MKTNSQKSLVLKRTRNSSSLNQCQPVDTSYSSITGFMRISLLTALALGLISKPYFAHAETNAVTSYLQEVAKSNAQELGEVIADNNWTRIEFSTTYIEPIVVFEEPVDSANNTYVIGIRNVTATGFEINLKNCDKSTEVSAQENVNFSVIDKSQLPVTESSTAKVRQQFSWGECCPAIDIPTGVVS
ncbi:MAG: hypothetical protein PHI13_14995 [Methylococcales bacterium]|nr:hypothetical protein [Methylococcales bacterium]